MRVIAGAIIILAGAILAAASAVAAALPQSQNRSSGPEVMWAAFGGIALIGGGGVVLGSAYFEKP